MRLRKQVHRVPANSRIGYTHYEATSNSSLVEDRYIPSHVSYYNFIQDENHWYCYPKCGGNMLISKKEIEYGHMSIKHGYDIRYTTLSGTPYVRSSYDIGGFVLPYNNFSLVPEVQSSGLLSDSFKDAQEPIDLTPTVNSLSAAGSNGFNRFRPKLERINFIESIAELPSTVKSLSLRAFQTQKRANRFGDAYVQSSFLWLPLVRDVVNFVDLCVNTEQRINNLVKSNGRWLRRSGILSNVSKSVSVDRPKSATLYRPAIGECTRAVHTVEISFKDSFIGMFRYWVPGISRRRYLGRLMSLNVLCGTRLTPSNIYNALPWSWLVDWATGAGDWVSDYSSRTADDCACKYAYVTRTLEAKSIMSVSMATNFATFTENTQTFASGSSTVRVKKKSRAGVTNNFSFSGGPLNDRQALILHSLMKGL